MSWRKWPVLLLKGSEYLLMCSWIFLHIYTQISIFVPITFTNIYRDYDERDILLFAGSETHTRWQKSFLRVRNSLISYLRVVTGETSWRIGPAFNEESGSWISSASAGGMSPADPSSKKNDRFGFTGWLYFYEGWKAGNITVECIKKL